MSKLPVVLVDFDGVIHQHDTPFEGVTKIPDQPVDGAIGWLRRMYEFNCGIVPMEAEDGPRDQLRNPTRQFRLAILSGRSRTVFGRYAMRRWLHREFIEAGYSHTMGPGWGALDQELMCWIEFPKSKPDNVIMSIDDRGYRFEGDDFINSKLEPSSIFQFKPWNKR